jgi:hypothetical protein
MPRERERERRKKEYAGKSLVQCKMKVDPGESE